MPFKRCRQSLSEHENNLPVDKPSERVGRVSVGDGIACKFTP